jgi:uncharacterized membrane protein
MWDQITDILGFILGIVLLCLSARASRTIVGSVFKRYHAWMIVGAALFSLSFLLDFIAIRSGEIAWLDVTHHIILLIAAIIFIATNLGLPRVASEYLNLQDKNKTGIK